MRGTGDPAPSDWLEDRDDHNLRRHTPNVAQASGGKNFELVSRASGHQVQLPITNAFYVAIVKGSSSAGVEKSLAGVESWTRVEIIIFYPGRALCIC